MRQIKEPVIHPLVPDRCRTPFVSRQKAYGPVNFLRQVDLDQNAQPRGALLFNSGWAGYDEFFRCGFGLRAAQLASCGRMCG